MIKPFYATAKNTASRNRRCIDAAGLRPATQDVRGGANAPPKGGAATVGAGLARYAALPLVAYASRDAKPGERLRGISSFTCGNRSRLYLPPSARPLHEMRRWRRTRHRPLAEDRRQGERGLIA
jgi:hypothetical protein